jgi:hypothetical protein
MMANRIVSVGCAATLVAGISVPNVAVMITLNIPTAIFMPTIYAQTAATNMNSAIDPKFGRLMAFIRDRMAMRELKTLRIRATNSAKRLHRPGERLEW